MNAPSPAPEKAEWQKAKDTLGGILKILTEAKGTPEEPDPTLAFLTTMATIQIQQLKVLEELAESMRVVRTTLTSR